MVILADILSMLGQFGEQGKLSGTVLRQETCCLPLSNLADACLEMASRAAGAGRKYKADQALGTRSAVLSRSFPPAPFAMPEDLKDKEEYLSVLRSDGFSGSFMKVLEFAAGRGCIWIKFDGDGHIWEELENRQEDWR